MKKQILDHGYIELIESWGSDERIIEAARMSTGKGFLGWGEPKDHNKCRKCGVMRVHAYPFDGGPQYHLPPNPPGNEAGRQCAETGGHEWEVHPGDEKLLQYLMENRHDTPFEFGGIVIEIQAPIMVFREWHRHRTASYNEMSARYEPLPDVNYVPTVERLLINSKTNKQVGVVKGAAVLDEDGAEWFRRQLTAAYQDDQALYEVALARGVPKELARAHLPVGRYSRMRAHTCLRNWLAFMTLRKDKNAQYEIRQYANALGDIVEQCFPRTWELFSLRHPGRWDDDGPDYYEFQIASLEKKLADIKKEYASKKVSL